MRAATAERTWRTRRQFVGHEVGIRHRSNQPRGRQQGAPGAQLLRFAGPVGGAIQELAGQFLPRQLAFLEQLAQGILGADLPTCSRLSNSSLNCPAGAALTSAAVVASRVPAAENRTSWNDHSPCSS